MQIIVKSILKEVFCGIIVYRCFVFVKIKVKEINFGKKQ